MLTRLQRARPFSVSKTDVNPLRYLLFNQLCTKIESTQVPESPELPSWAKADPASACEDDDFVIPSLANWIETRSLDDPGKVVQQFLYEATELDVDKMSKILKNRYSSPEEAAQALDGCGLSVSENTVEQLLKRFSHEQHSVFSNGQKRRQVTSTPLSCITLWLIS